MFLGGCEINEALRICQTENQEFQATIEKMQKQIDAVNMLAESALNMQAEKRDELEACMNQLSLLEEDLKQSDETTPHSHWKLWSYNK